MLLDLPTYSIVHLFFNKAYETILCGQHSALQSLLSVTRVRYLLQLVDTITSYRVILEI